jgi:hypothetical protein
MILFSQFQPAYAYGHFVQHLSTHPKSGLLGAELVELPDTSDEALWKLVDEEMYRNGTTPEELEQSRADHRCRQALARRGRKWMHSAGTIHTTRTISTSTAGAVRSRLGKVAGDPQRPGRAG